MLNEQLAKNLLKTIIVLIERCERGKNTSRRNIKAPGLGILMVGRTSDSDKGLSIIY